jgi:hypothetical protein
LKPVDILWELNIAMSRRKVAMDLCRKPHDVVRLGPLRRTIVGHND